MNEYSGTPVRLRLADTTPTCHRRCVQCCQKCVHRSIYFLEGSSFPVLGQVGASAQLHRGRVGYFHPKMRRLQTGDEGSVLCPLGRWFLGQVQSVRWCSLYLLTVRTAVGTSVEHFQCACHSGTCPCASYGRRCCISHEGTVPSVRDFGTR